MGRSYFSVVAIVSAFALGIALAISSDATVANPMLTEDKASAEFQTGRDGRLLLVPVHVFGKVIPFMVDTGAARTTVDECFRPQLGSVVGQRLFRTSSGTLTLDLFDCPIADIEGISLGRIGTIACCDLQLLRRASGHEIFGILGMDFLVHFSMELDFDSGTLKLWKNSPQNWTSQGTRLDLTMIDGAPAVKIGLPDQSDQFIIDTGANSSCIQEELFDRMISSRRISPSTARYHAATVNAESQDSSGYLETISLGPYTHRWLRLDRAHVNGLGLTYLSHFKLRFDFPDRSLYIDKGSRYARTEKRATSGLSIFVLDGDKVVSQVEPGGAADAAGIKVNDIILAIDEQLAVELDMHDLRELLTTEPGRRLVVSLKRQVERISTTIELRERCAVEPGSTD